MTDLDRLTDAVDAVSTADGDRYSQLVEVHEQLRAALAETGDSAATGR